MAARQQFCTFFLDGLRFGVDVQKVQEVVPYQVPFVKAAPEPHVFINPKILWASDETIVCEEGCLSVPEIWEDVERPARIKAEHLDRNGKLVTLEAVEALREKAGQHVIVEFSDTVSEQELERIPGVSALTKINGTYHFNISGSMDQLIKELGQYEVIRLTSQEAPLEDVFLKFYEEPAQAAPVP